MMTDTKESKKELKVGQIWKTADGKKWKISECKDVDYPFTAENGNSRFDVSSTGNYWADETPHHMDLIELVKDVEDNQESPTKYTVEEVIKAMNKVCSDNVSIIEEYLAKKNNPEYTEYLRLKNKFERN
jgi:hypothetical protein